MPPIRFFLDFDGTIAATDVVDLVLERFAKKEWKIVENDWAQGRIGSRECLSRQIDFVMAKDEDLLALAQEVGVDPFFVSFLKTAHQQGVPVSIVSDGFDMLIEPILKKALAGEPEILNALPVSCNRLYWTGKGLKAIFSGSGCSHGCANCKPAAMDKLTIPGEYRVFVGDGLSDRFAAMHADLTFAKGRLLEFCQTKNLNKIAYSNFGDIQTWLLSQGLSQKAVLKG